MMTPDLLRQAAPPLAAAGGFTLIELMMALTILGILTTLALPSFGKFVRDQRVKTATTEVYASLVFARSESIKRGADVLVSPTSTANWALGWKVIDAGANDLKIQNAIPGVTMSGPASLTYRRDGRVSGTAVSIFVLSALNGAVVDNAITARCVRVDPSGRPNITADSNNNPADGCQ